MIEDECALLVGTEVTDGEVIIRGGDKVSANNIERALLLHPCVREAAAFGVPHPRLGENIAAAVTLQPGATTTPLELQKFLRGHLANFKIPQRIDIVTSLLKSHNGKVLKAQLAEAVINSEHRIDPPEKLLEYPILKIWQRLLERDDIGIHDDFFEAGGDSVLWTEMILEVEELSKHRFTNSDVAEAVTIRQLAAITAADSDELVTKAKDGSGQPLFFCHGDYETHGFYALNLAALLEPDQPVYLVNPPVDVTETSELVIEDMARLYVPRLLALQPQGSFRLGGYCNGGLLAWEIAHQLLRAGREVDAVVLIDSHSLNARPLYRGLHRSLQSVAGIAPTKRFERILRREVMPAVWRWTREAKGNTCQFIGLAVRSFRDRVARINGAAKPFASLVQKRHKLYACAMANYVPPVLDCVVLAIACELNANTFGRSTKPWTGLAPTVRHLVVPGDHRTCVTTHVETLAQLLNVQQKDIPRKSGALSKNVVFKKPELSERKFGTLPENLLLPSGIDGVYARTAAFEDVVNGLAALISRHREPGTEVLRFPPVMSRRHLEKSGYLKSFPHFLGCVCCLNGAEADIRGTVERFEGGEDWTPALSAADLVLTPAACYPVYPLVASRGDVPAAGLLFDVASDCFRREPSRDLDRLQSFRMREYVCIGTPEQIDDFRRRWMARAQDVAGQLGLPFQLVQASDAFFGRGGELMAMSQIEQALKFELLVPIRSAEQPTACMSFNYHRDHFGTSWNLRNAAGQVMHTGCVAFGMDRLALALFAAHGLDMAGWPRPVCEALALALSRRERLTTVGDRSRSASVTREEATPGKRGPARRMGISAS